MPVYAFDIQLNTTARTIADTEAQAREHLAALDSEFEIGYSTDEAGGAVWLTDASMAHDAQAACMVEPYPEDGPAPAQAAGPLYRAGRGDYRTVQALLHASQWTWYTDATGENTTQISADHHLAVEFGYRTPGIVTRCRVAYRDPHPYRPDSWSASFDDGTPAEAVTAFLAALTAPSRRPDADGETGTEH